VQSLAAILPLIIKIVKWVKAKITKSTTRVEPTETPVTLAFYKKSQSLEEIKEVTDVNIVSLEEEIRGPMNSKDIDDID